MGEVNSNALIVLAMFVTVAVIVGAVATAAGRRVVESDRAHGDLAQEQAALRRVATLVAGGARPAAVFTAVADELAGLIGADATFVARRDEPATGEAEDFPAGTESRIRDFIELAAVAIANTQAEQELRVLAGTQEALRRLALLIAQGVAPDVVFAAVTKEVLRHFGNGTARLIRYELDGTATLLANEGTTGPHVQVGHAWKGYPPTGLTATVQRSGQTARWTTTVIFPAGRSTPLRA